MNNRVVRASSGDQPFSGVLRRLTVIGAALAVLATGACGNGTAATPSQPATSGAATKAAPAGLGADQYLENGADYISTVDWTRAPKVHVELGEMFFKPKNIPLKAGIPVVFELVNKGVITHEFTADEFFRSSSIRKIQSAHSEVRVPFFTEIEVLAGQTVKVFAIPVIAGEFPMLCRLPGHREAGMVGMITVTGATTGLPAPVLKSMKTGPWLQNNEELVKAALPTWDAKVKTVQIEAGEGGEGGAGMYFKPRQLELKVGTPYVIQLVNAGSILHEYTADEFFPTVAFRKAQDLSGEYKSPLLKEAEVLGKKKLDLYLIPTKAGIFKIVCKLEGHEKAGMVGTIRVTA
jgi:uncharacterized cupredoxin-like copper-binding protein